MAASPVNPARVKPRLKPPQPQNKSMNVNLPMTLHPDEKQGAGGVLQVAKAFPAQKFALQSRGEWWVWDKFLRGLRCLVV